MRTFLICLFVCLLNLGCVEYTKKNPAKKEQAAKPAPALVNDNEREPAISLKEFEGDWGHLTGKFVLNGEVPEIPFEGVDEDCLGDEPPRLDNKLVIGPKRELKNVFVMMYLKGCDPPAVHPSYEKTKSKPVVLEITNCRYTPHAIFVRTGQTLRRINNDDVGHNGHVTTFNNESSCNLPAGQWCDQVFRNADTSPGSLASDLYNWMEAKVLVRDEPYAAISAEDGSFTIENIPAGDWKFQFWHELAGNLRELQVEGYEVGRRGEIELTIADGETLDLGTMSIAGEELDH